MASSLSARRRALQSRIGQINAELVTSSKALQKALDDWIELTHEDGLMAAMACLSNCYSRLVQRTPVDTGRARAGWHIETELNDWAPSSSDYPKTKTEPYASLPPLSSKDREALAKTLEKLPSLTKADIVYIMSNIEYILPLEAGWSKQSSGFWGLFITELKNQLEQAAANSRRGNP